MHRHAHILLYMLYKRIPCASWVIQHSFCKIANVRKQQKEKQSCASSPLSLTEPSPRLCRPSPGFVSLTHWHGWAGDSFSSRSSWDDWCKYAAAERRHWRHCRPDPVRGGGGAGSADTFPVVCDCCLVLPISMFAGVWSFDFFSFFKTPRVSPLMDIYPFMCICDVNSLRSTFFHL